MASPTKRILFKDFIACKDGTISDPFPGLKHDQTRVSRLKDTAALLSRVIPDLEIRALCLHPSSNKFDSKIDSSYTGTYDVDKVELVHSRLAAAVADLNQSQVNAITASVIPIAEWLKNKNNLS